MICCSGKVQPSDPPPTTVVVWGEDVKVDVATRGAIKEHFENPGPYSPVEDKLIKQGLDIIDKLGGDATKRPEVKLTKHETNTPLLSAFMCYDKTTHQTYGKVVCTVRPSFGLGRPRVHS